MSVVERLHSAHVARQARLWGTTRPPVVRREAVRERDKLVTELGSLRFEIDAARAELNAALVELEEVESRLQEARGRWSATWRKRWLVEGPQAGVRGGDDALHALAREICAKYAVELHQLRSRRKATGYVVARQEFCYRAVSELAHSYSEIGRFLRKDHTTVIHNANKYADDNGLARLSRSNRPRKATEAA